MEKIDELLKLAKLNNFLITKVRDYKQTLKNLDSEKHKQLVKEIREIYGYYSILGTASENLLIEKSRSFLNVSLGEPRKETKETAEKEDGKFSDNVIPFPSKKIEDNDE